ncbi:adenylylsulfate kinase [Desulfobaculum xiamenense]|uniref:Adenylyl-sulfate kinase n=1 Tax=Desulfobaculum xiamenense TaxID=995050 RepID=A0A846QQ79_9BACT|nr:adenylyl-sulfate kinase [Desulfobaculum xiamenense]NJB67555.1 adenylylsulfate kinase [Desulfobaculum xiamenense]
MSDKRYIKIHTGEISRPDREKKNGHKGHVFWFTGLSGSGKSTIAHHVETHLHHHGIRSYVLDGDNVRHGLCSDLSFSPEARSENVRRIGEVSKLFVDAGIVCLCAFITPLKADRDLLRQILGTNFSEIFVSCPLCVCESRDVKGYYKLAREGKIKNYTGISAPYKIPEQPDLRLETASLSIERCVENTLNYVMDTIL